MIVAVIAMGVMQMPGDDVVDMVAVRNRFMAATGTMLVSSVMGAAIMPWRAVGWIGTALLQSMLVDMVPVHVVKMAIVQIVRMVFVLDGGMTAPFAMNVAMSFVN
jgi:hypothetical protein